ncbi:hypothetical protein EJ07DRAFT_39543, partial [Lizonia empirigonia]
FSRLRLDVMLASVSGHATFMNFHRVVKKLVKEAQSLRHLDIRVGFAHDQVSAAIRDHGLALANTHEDVVSVMRSIARMVRLQEGTHHSSRKPIHIRWGVSE